MNEKKQTAVEWLKNELFIKADLIINKDGNLELFELIRIAKMIEKRQIKDAYLQGYEDKDFSFFRSDDYYHEKY
jgi:hypothetical protein